ncbi:MAG: hypothetical protein AMS22_05360 [Thiotrichales bacterium SG8_50]|nr:MAG: hypothetical protein AMS22_05360 [Thiotrichales bacterium SG8_50]
MNRRIVIMGVLTLLVFTSVSCSYSRRFQEVRRFVAPEAQQGVAVDAEYVYVVGTRRIGKYDKQTAECTARWEGTEDGPIIHLDSGVVVDGKLYCAHSNYPKLPMTSSVEIWDTGTLEHVGRHDFGVQYGSCTWFDRHDGYWWAVFAQYDRWKHATGKGTESTTLVKFDGRRKELKRWVFPKEVVERIIPMSNSGGSWGPDGYLYCTGHDRSEVYVTKIPDRGSVLELVETMPLPVLGQGIAWDRSRPGFIYGIRRKSSQVVVSRLK